MLTFFVLNVFFIFEQFMISFAYLKGIRKLLCQKIKLGLVFVAQGLDFAASFRR